MAPPTKSVILETAKQVRDQHASPEPQNKAGRQVHDDLEYSSDRVISGRVTKPTKTAKPNRGRVTGDDMKSPKKKKPTDQADNTFMWANNASWLQQYLGLVPADQSTTMRVSGLLHAAKWVYIIQHEITPEDIFSLLRGDGNQFMQSSEYMWAARSMSDNQSRWQGSVMDDFIYPRVADIVIKWAGQAGNPCKRFPELTPAQSQNSW
ncbi:hypothetical protein AA0119_g10974 [Alternaria tenuissima]|jgi:hypothetical protein|uniref:Uncharacterized protein n=1 Tax=Alternaria tenuissima TaxID=119927 RepID=A0ABY0FX99_9PLEO|nr:hypothetical protein AALT_g10334 [Alternaria alternata]RYN90849.1 hypothetical protein AA0119_g10974 [Alternaria tenuissima]RYO07102.1 hypothetical protein AA0121_g11780 [Alternaria tenuissima]